MPAPRRRLFAHALTVLGSVTVIVTALLSSASGASQLLLTLGGMLPLLSLVIARRTVPLMPGLADSPMPNQQTSDDREAFEAWREQVSESLQQQSEQLDRKREQLNQRMLRYREILEYPTDDPTDDASERASTELSECDREVNRILEQEAARVYEKIRADGYRIDGQLDVDTIRQETRDLIERVARVYSPDSENPLLETSFDQLARAASRVCLQALVLVEQLPLDVQHYTIAEMYNYVRTAAGAWGAWQTVAPWMTRVSRGLYAGRLAAGASPVTLGAWWVASELGRHGTKRLVDHYVDQQAVAFFHDAVRLIGNEAACIYGPGLRQRDPAWVYGAELTELQHRFPQSRASLQAGLREITGLPLRSEYDRIYLYRCLAEHKASGRRLADPTVLTRDERESIAKRLESFFQDHIHGADADAVSQWQDSVEQHLDLRLSLSEAAPAATPSGSRLDAVWSIQSFLIGAGGLSTTDASRTVGSSRLFGQLNSEQQEELRQRTDATETSAFEPPDLDPDDPLTQEFLDGLITSCVRAPLYDSALETLLIETGRYFRRGSEEMQQAIAHAWKQGLDARTLPDAPLPRRGPLPARQLLQLLQSGESVAAVYAHAEVQRAESSPDDPDQDVWLAVLQKSTDRRLLLVSGDQDGRVLWTDDGRSQAERIGGVFNDDCVITGGRWTDDQHEAGRILLPGHFGRSYQTWFGPLL